MSSTTTPPAGALYGIWHPVKEEPTAGPAAMEWWPSQAALFRSMRQRLTPAHGTTDPINGNQDPARHVFQPDRPDAQFYGRKDSCCILLYASPDDDRPSEIVEFGPRGGLRRSPYTPS